MNLNDYSTYVLVAYAVNDVVLTVCAVSFLVKYFSVKKQLSKGE